MLPLLLCIPNMLHDWGVYQARVCTKYIDNMTMNIALGMHSSVTQHLGGCDSIPLTFQALTEVLLSIDRAMEKIHDEATLQGGFYNPQQKIALQ